MELFTFTAEYERQLYQLYANFLTWFTTGHDGGSLIDSNLWRTLGRSIPSPPQILSTPPHGRRCWGLIKDGTFVISRDLIH